MDAYFAAFPSDFECLGVAFAKAYYTRLQTNRNSVADLYHDMALMTYEGTKIQGKQAIAKHFQVCWLTLLKELDLGPYLVNNRRRYQHMRFSACG
ncbi:unnamed protein product [Mesocestoides corti]|uniref:NTF2 domain-containing protein n=1 Tax=Mesocestoides corti TaxID=53468 RepID=A0A0R3UH15_MESCO|nr:unnamed protein product [Mesocestoides corti]